MTVLAGEAYLGKGFHLHKQFPYRVFFRKFRLPHFPAQGAHENECDELDEEPTVHGRGAVGAEAFHIQLVFQVVKTFFDDILVAVHHERLKGVLDIIGHNGIKPGVQVAVVLYGFMVEEHLATPDRVSLTVKKVV